MPEERARRWLEKVRRFLRLDRMHPIPRKFLVSVFGGLILIAGVIMLITPGPAFILIPVGLLVLGSEFAWAQKALKKALEAVERLRLKWKRRKERARASSS